MVGEQNNAEGEYEWDLSIENLDSDSSYIHLTPLRMAILHVDRIASSVAKVETSNENWWHIITDADNALTCLLVSYLSGSMQIGALEKKCRDLWHERLDSSPSNPTQPVDKSTSPIPERIANLGELLERASDRNYGYASHSGALQLSNQEMKDVLRLHDFRNDIAHVKPRSWSLEVVGLPRILLVVMKAITLLFENSQEKIHLKEAEVSRMESLMSTTAKMLERLSSVNDR